MSIEDIDYLYKNSIKDNAVIFVDSSKRDKLTYPDPNSYTINFDEPFKYVYGIEILDASIPRAMYQIDENNNKLVVVIGDATFESITQLDHLTNDKIFKHQNDEEVDSNSDGRYLNNKLELYVDGMSSSQTITANDVLAIDYTDSNDSSNNGKYIGTVSSNIDIINGVKKTITFNKALMRIGDGRSLPNSDVGDTFKVLGKYNKLTLGDSSSSATELKKITVNFDPQDLELDDLASGLTGKLEGNNNNNDVSIFVRPVSSPSSEISKLMFYSGDEPDIAGYIANTKTKIFYILGAISTLTDNLGFSENAIDNNRGSNSTVHDYNRITETEAKVLYEITDSDWNSYTTEQKNFYINNTFKSGDNNIGDVNKYNLGKNPSFKPPEYDNEFPDLDTNNIHRIQTPGIVNLVGERFITLRSDAIEQHLSSFYSGSNSIGIGLFKLGFSGYVDARFDFSSVKYKDLHPIGKLSSIDLRFERIDGELYNFRGLNHHMLISIKYLVPYKKPENFDYTLNTNYNPDLLEYKRTQYEKDDNSEDEINELANNFKKNFLEKEKEYEYSSDEDLEYVDVRNDITDSESSIDESSDDDSDDDNNNHNNHNNHNLTPYNRFYKYD